MIDKRRMVKFLEVHDVESIAQHIILVIACKFKWQKPQSDIAAAATAADEKRVLRKATVSERGERDEHAGRGVRQSSSG